MIDETPRSPKPPSTAAVEGSDQLMARLTVIEKGLASLDGNGHVDLAGLGLLEQQLTELTLGVGGLAAEASMRAAVLSFQHAFLRRMLENLDVLLERIVARLREGDATRESRAAVVLLLDHLGRGLRLHFDHEERDGSLVRALEEAPRFQRRASGLQAEHRDFLARAADLHGTALRADQSTQRWRSVHEAFQALREALADHERAETEIVQSVWNDDLGGRG